MLSSIKSLVLFAVMTYSVSATNVAAPKCGAHHKVTRRDCTNALSSYIADKHGFVDQNKKDNQKSCGECQIHVYTSDGSNLRFTMKGAQAALESVLRSCGNGYGSVSIAEDLMPGMRVSPTVLSVEKGSGRSCGSSPPSVAAPKCVARNTNTVTRRDCTNALSSYIADKHGFVDQNKKDNQKSCGECQIHVYTSDGSNLRFTMEGAQKALDSVLRSCGNGYGSVRIAEDLMPGMRVSPTVLSVEKGSGRFCGLLRDN